MKVIVFSPDLTNIRAWFDIPKRYYQRNKEMVEGCDLLHAFISAEDGFIGGTKFEVEYAVSLGIPVQVHNENGLSQWIFQYSFPFLGEKADFFLAWEGFFQRCFGVWFSTRHRRPCLSKGAPACIFLGRGFEGCPK
jgi:hypothetical protein